MLLEFKIYELIKGSRYHDLLVEKHNNPNDFIIVGEEKIKDIEYYKTQQISKKGLMFVGDLKIDEMTYNIPKKDLVLKDNGLPGYELHEFDIPKKYLTMDIIETIQRLNE